MKFVMVKTMTAMEESMKDLFKPATINVVRGKVSAPMVNGETVTYQIPVKRAVTIAMTIVMVGQMRHFQNWDNPAKEMNPVQPRKYLPVQATVGAMHACQRQRKSAMA